MPATVPGLSVSGPESLGCPAGMSDPAAPTCVSVTTVLRAKPGCEAAVEAALDGLARAVRRDEAGCLLYQPVRSRHEPGHFLVFERYRDDAALAAHANAEHFRAVIPELLDCLSEPPALVLYDELVRPGGSGAS